MPFTGGGHSRRCWSGGRESSVLRCAEFEVAVGHLSENIENSWIQEMNRGYIVESWEP